MTGLRESRSSRKKEIKLIYFHEKLCRCLTSCVGRMCSEGSTSPAVHVSSEADQSVSSGSP